MLTNNNAVAITIAAADPGPASLNVAFEPLRPVPPALPFALAAGKTTWVTLTFAPAGVGALPSASQLILKDPAGEGRLVWVLALGGRALLRLRHAEGPTGVA